MKIEVDPDDPKGKDLGKKSINNIKIIYNKEDPTAYIELLLHMVKVGENFLRN